MKWFSRLSPPGLMIASPGEQSWASVAPSKYFCSSSGSDRANHTTRNKGLQSSQVLLCPCLLPPGLWPFSIGALCCDLSNSFWFCHFLRQLIHCSLYKSVFFLCFYFSPLSFKRCSWPLSQVCLQLLLLVIFVFYAFISLPNGSLRSWGAIPRLCVSWVFVPASTRGGSLAYGRWLVSLSPQLVTSARNSSSIPINRSKRDSSQEGPFWRRHSQAFFFFF